jgi:trans-aconitate 2-methyltransferase
MRSSWSPARYEKFKLQRAKPFYDLVKMIQKEEFGCGIDLGCGTGELTRELFNEIQPRELTGVDSSPEMLDRSARFRIPGLDFELQDIAEYRPKNALDLVFSNAALHWLPAHEVLIPKILNWVSPGGQVAIQMPFNFDHPSHWLAKGVAVSLFPDVFSAEEKMAAVLPVEQYAEILFERGFEDQICRVEVYGHSMPSGEDVVEWTRGTLLTAYQSRLSGEDFERFLAKYRTELLKKIGTGPYFYAFKRILIWGRKK